MSLERNLDPAAPPTVSEGVSEQKMILGWRVVEIAYTRR